MNGTDRIAEQQAERLRAKAAAQAEEQRRKEEAEAKAPKTSLPEGQVPVGPGAPLQDQVAPTPEQQTQAIAVGPKLVVELGVKLYDNGDGHLSAPLDRPDLCLEGVKAILQGLLTASFERGRQAAFQEVARNPKAGPVQWLRNKFKSQPRG